jgi:hypothetical protein
MMIALQAVQLAASAIVLAGYAGPDTSVTYRCKFEAGVVEIDRSHDGATVRLDGAAQPYIVNEDKLVALEAGLPTFYFQAELKRWKRLNRQGETVETTVCKMVRA